MVRSQLLQGRVISAIRLLKNGKKILFEMRNSRVKLDSTVSEQYLRIALGSIFMRLDLQVSAVR